MKQFLLVLLFFGASADKDGCREVEVEENKLVGLMRAAMELKVKGLFKEGQGEGCSQNGKKGLKAGKSNNIKNCPE